MKEISVYVAGPLYSSADLVTNNRRAIDAAQELEQADVEGVIFRPFIPHVFALTWQFVYPRGHQLAQDWDDYWLRKCDMMLRLPGYSVGCEHEERVALTCDLPVFATPGAMIAAVRYSRAIEAYRQSAIGA
jgi:hypothetical protein